MCVSTVTNYLLNMLKPSEFKFDPETMMEHPVGDSLTVPDDTLSIREIITRFNNGSSLVNNYRNDPVASEVGLDGQDDDTMYNLDVDDEIVDPILDPAAAEASVRSALDAAVAEQVKAKSTTLAAETKSQDNGQTGTGTTGKQDKQE